MANYWSSIFFVSFFGNFLIHEILSFCPSGSSSVYPNTSINVGRSIIANHIPTKSNAPFVSYRLVLISQTFRISSRLFR
jgi:hypothetical protein